jgi:hypothetical protein
LRETRDERIFNCVLGLERLSKTAEDLLVFVAVLFAEDNKSRGSEAVGEAIEAAALFTGFGFRPAATAIAPVCCTLSF